MEGAYHYHCPKCGKTVPVKKRARHERKCKGKEEG